VTFYYLGGGVGAIVADRFWHWAGWRGCVALFGAVAFVSLGMALVSSRPTDQLHSEEAEVVAD
jgi:hypothetical protein